MQLPFPASAEWQYGEKKKKAELQLRHLGHN